MKNKSREQFYKSASLPSQERKESNSSSGNLVLEFATTLVLPSA